MRAAELEEIRADIWAEPWKDPQLFPDLLNHAVSRLGEIATGEHFNCGPGMCRLTATPEARRVAAELLREMHRRALSGIPFGEPAYGDLGPTNPEDL